MESLCDTEQLQRTREGDGSLGAACKACGPLAEPIDIMVQFPWPVRQQPQEQAEWHGAIPAFACK